MVHAGQPIVNRVRDSNGGMRIFIAITCIALAGCSGSDVVQTAEALDMENIVRACMTDEILREAHATEAEIAKFKKDQVEAGAFDCG